MQSSVLKRFEAKYSKVEGGCWTWAAATNYGIHPSKKWPYGTFKIDGKQKPAHRASYELLVGPIPEGLELDHLCRNTLCVNPAHLEPVTHQENIRRGYAVRPKQTHCVKGHEFTAENTYVKPARKNKVSHRECRICRRDQLAKHYAKRKED